jgi:hypothetical protein
MDVTQVFGYQGDHDVQTAGFNTAQNLPYNLKSNPHPFYSFRGLNNQMHIRFAVESWILEK